MIIERGPDKTAAPESTSEAAFEFFLAPSGSVQHPLTPTARARLKRDR
jgi:hypothetical protein